MRNILCIAFLLGISYLPAQQLFLENNYQQRFEKSIYTQSNFHTSIKPYNTEEIEFYDSIYNELYLNKNTAFAKKLFNEALVNTENFQLSPLFNLSYFYEKNDSSHAGIQKSLGLLLRGKIKSKWTYSAAFLVDDSYYPTYISLLAREKNITPGYGYATGDINTGFTSVFGNGYLNFKANDHFNFRLGYGKHFFGDGYRSMFLSDVANSFPYLMITTKAWKFKYINLFSLLSDINGSLGVSSNYHYKFTTTHYLSWNIAKWINLGFFESIVFQAQEGNYYRGMDLNYWNPVIFLRPVEYASGSADNALMGTSLKIQPFKKTVLYSQFLIDEFLLKEIRAGNGWWANKFAVQAGFKWFDVFGIKNTNLFVEYNLVRPFTYSYYYEFSGNSTLQNYGHFNVPLAHILGANFKELTTGLFWYKKRWSLSLNGTYIQTGIDSTSENNVGQDIYKPYNTRDKEYGNTIGQGLPQNIINLNAQLNYLINPSNNLNAFIGIRLRNNELGNTSSNAAILSVGIKTAITNRYFDF